MPKRDHTATHGLEVRVFQTGGGLEIRADRTGDGNAVTISGAAVAFGAEYQVTDSLGSYTERMLPGVATNVLNAGADVRFLFNHTGMPLARTTSGTLSLTQTDTELRFTATLDRRQSHASDLIVAIERGDVSQMSCAFVVADDVWSDGDTHRTIRSFRRLDDVSAVTYPASPTTHLQVAQQRAAARRHANTRKKTERMPDNHEIDDSDARRLTSEPVELQDLALRDKERVQWLIAHRERAGELQDIRQRFETSADAYLGQAAALVRGREAQFIPADEWREFSRQLDKGLSSAKRAEQIQKLELREREQAAKITREPGPYEAGAPNSWIRDLIAATDPASVAVRDSGVSDMTAAAVLGRLDRHAQDVRTALLKGDEYGRRCERMISESYRVDDPVVHRDNARRELRERRRDETRALSTGGGATWSATISGSAFVPPAILIDSIWAPFRSPYRAFADQCNSTIPLPDYGMEVYLPAVTTGTTVGTVTEGSGVPEGDPVATLAGSPVVMKAGQVTASQQFLDRAGPGVTGDQILITQLREQLDAQIDQFAIAQALAGATTITNTGTFAIAGTSGVGGLLKDLKSAKNTIHDAAGVRLRATHLFAVGDFCDFVTGYADANGRPVFLPTLDDYRLPIKAQGDPTGEGYTGYVLSGLSMHADDNIPGVGSNTQLIVCRPDTILQLEGAPVPYVIPETFAGNLEALIGLRVYVATIARFPSGVATITGSAYAASTFA